MKKIIGGVLFESHNAKETRWLNKLEKLMTPPEPACPIERFKVLFTTKKGTFFRILDGIDEASACTSTGVRQDQIISVERVGKEVPCTPNKPFFGEGVC